jgi:diguanylate cyclase (GGDEF)-like protein/PAS domain S-box-containing protein
LRLANSIVTHPKGRPNWDIDLRPLLATSQSIVLTDSTQFDDPIVFVNPAFCQMTGYAPEEILGRNCHFLQGPDTDRTAIEIMSAAVENGLPVSQKVLNYRKNGDAFWAHVALDPIRDEFGRLLGFIRVQSDLGMAQRREAAAAQNVPSSLQSISNNIPGYVFRRVLLRDGTLALPFISASLNAILGVSDREITTEDFLGYLHPDDRSEFRQAVERSARELSIFEEEIRLVAPSGDVHWFRSNAVPHPLPDGGVVWDGMAIEITSEKTAKIELNFLASHDALTGLSNRVAFRNTLAETIGHLSEDHQAGLYYVDLDGFQVVNDSWGEAFGDMVLRRAGIRLSEFAVSRGGVAARLGDDEFAVLLPGLKSGVQHLELAESIRRVLGRPMHIEGRAISLEVSVGIAAVPLARGPDAPAHSDIATELIERAYLALQDAKRRGPGLTRLYSPESDERFRNQRALRQSLQRAVVEPKEFELYYQPLVNLACGDIIGAEALIRWNHPELGFQRPDLFIPLAESSGLIVPLGAWVLKDAMRQGQVWRRSGLRTPRISINVSGVQLQRPGFLATVEQALRETDADPRDFELELTEGVLIDAATDIRKQLSTLKGMGFELAIDDFGTGHSTFRYLRDFPIDTIKIDQTFVRHLVIGSSDASIISAMIGLARSLRVRIVAEGIETVLQRNFLRDEGCEIGQGYLFSMPLTADDFGRLLEQGVSLPMSEDPQ